MTESEAGTDENKLGRIVVVDAASESVAVRDSSGEVSQPSLALSKFWC